MTDFVVHTFGGFEVLHNGRRLSLPLDVERLIALLSVRPPRSPRSVVASTLWASGNDDRVLGNLRSVLWRLRRKHPELIAADNQAISLAARVVTDVSLVIDRSERLLTGEAGVERADPTETGDSMMVLDSGHELLDYRLFVSEFLPGWYDEWVLVERERYRQICLHSLEAIARCHMAARRFGAAIQVLMSCIALDDLRESPRRQLMFVHLAEGNRSDAIREYDEYRAKLQDGLGLTPSPSMQELLQVATGAVGHVT